MMDVCCYDCVNDLYYVVCDEIVCYVDDFVCCVWSGVVSVMVSVVFE